MPNPTIDQLAKLCKVAEKLEHLETEVAKKFPGIKKLLEEVYDMDPKWTTEEDFRRVSLSCAQYVKDVEKFRETIKPVIVEAFSAAKNELLGKDAKLCQALAAVARGDKGRAGPKEDDVDEYNHIHIGGNAKDNLLFQVKSRVILGRLDFHLEQGLPEGKKKQLQKVAGRSGAKVELKVVDDEVVEA